jgi:hypothetical protein
MEAFAEEKLRAVKDIDEKKDFLDIIKSALALKSSLLLAENHAEWQKGMLVKLTSCLSSARFTNRSRSNDSFQS